MHFSSSHRNKRAQHIHKTKKTRHKKLLLHTQKRPNFLHTLINTIHLHSNPPLTAITFPNINQPEDLPHQDNFVPTVPPQFIVSTNVNTTTSTPLLQTSSHKLHIDLLTPQHTPIKHSCSFPRRQKKSRFQTDVVNIDSNYDPITSFLSHNILSPQPMGEAGDNILNLLSTLKGKISHTNQVNSSYALSHKKNCKLRSLTSTTPLTETSATLRKQRLRAHFSALLTKHHHIFEQTKQLRIHTSVRRHIQTKYNTIPGQDIKTKYNYNSGNDGYNPASHGGQIDQIINYVSPTQHTKGVYTSTHYKIDKQVISDYLTRKNLTYKQTGDKTILMECPICPKPTYGKPDNMWKCCIFDNGGFVCLRCQSRGSWFDFKAKLGDIPQITTAAGKPVYQAQQIIERDALNNGGDIVGENDEYFQEGQASGATSGMHTLKNKINNADYIENQQQNYATISQVDIQRMVDSLDASPTILEYFENTRKIKLDTLKKYKIGAHSFKFPTLNITTNQIEWKENECIIFPWTDRKSVSNSDDVIYSRIKARSVTEKKNMRLLPKGGPWGFFGWHTVPLDAKTIIITEGELDAMSVYQATGLPVISLPNGANSLPPALLPCLERFEKVILWLDDDQAGHGAVEAMSTKLGLQRTYHIPGGYGAKDANEALQKGLNIANIIDTASRQQHKQISHFSSFRHEVKRMFLDPNTQVGVPYPNMPVLQSLIKGHRRGELTILTGGTGVGKTTLLTQLSLELATQGVNTLWGSFEIRNPRLVKTLLKQYAATQGIVLNEQHHDTFDYVADQFEELPFNFLKFYGSSPVQEVIEAMDYATYVHDVQHVILDNLQFMLSGQGRATGDKFDLQDRAIEAFRQFASQRNVHVTLVIHPRKEQDNQSLGLASVFGSAKATQEADNVMIIQGGLPRTVLRNVQLPMGDNNSSAKKQTMIRQSDSPGLVQHGGFEDPIIGEIISTYFRTIEIRKNRWDGDLGAVPMRFDKASNRFYELTNDDIQLGLGDFIAQQKKLKQMDLIKHINQVGPSQQQQQQQQQQQRSGFQSFLQKPPQNGGNYNKRYSNNNNTNVNNSGYQKTSQLSPQQEFELHQQFQREKDDMIHAMLSDGDDEDLSFTETPTSAVNSYGSPQAFELNNMKNKMHEELEEVMHKTGISSGDLRSHPNFNKMQSIEQQLHGNNKRAQVPQPPRNPMEYQGTIDIIED